MSSYQFYEFQAVDRPLTPGQMGELRDRSSRAEITATRLTVTYNWSDLKGDPKEWMERYFDAHLYFSNWGARVVMLRIQAGLIDGDLLEEYCVKHRLWFHRSADSLILCFRSEDEDGDYREDEGWLSSILPVRRALARGDLRALYLGWLIGVDELYVDDDEIEPPLPAGLGNLDPSLLALIDFLVIDPDLVAAAAEGSPDSHTARPSEKEVAEWVHRLPGPEKESLLVRLIADNDSSLADELLKRAGREGKRETTGPATGRTAGFLRNRAEILATERNMAEARRKAEQLARHERDQAEKRLAYLTGLVGSEEDLWKKAADLAEAKQKKAYVEAVSLLKDLADLAKMAGNRADFQSRMDAFYTSQSRKPSLREMIYKAGLVT